MDNRLTTFQLWILCVFFVRVFCETDQNSLRNNAGLSRAFVYKLLAKYPKSPWWISNARVADFCRIKNDKDMHNSAVLGRYLPRKQVFWEKCQGLCCKTCINPCQTYYVLYVLFMYWFVMVYFCLLLYIWRNSTTQCVFNIWCVCMHISLFISSQFGCILFVRQVWANGNGELKKAFSAFQRTRANLIQTATLQQTRKH